MITFYPSDYIKNFIIEKGREEKLPGMGGGIIDARKYIHTLIDSLYAESWAFAELQPGPVVDRIQQRLWSGLQANVGHVAYFPPDDAAKDAVVEAGLRAKIPGMGGGLFDSRKYVTFAVTKLAEKNIRLVLLIKDGSTNQIWDRLNNQTSAPIPEW